MRIFGSDRPAEATPPPAADRDWALREVQSIAHLLHSHYGPGYSLGEVSRGVARLITDQRRTQRMLDAAARGEVYVPPGHVRITLPDQTAFEVAGFRDVAPIDPEVQT